MPKALASIDYGIFFFIQQRKQDEERKSLNKFEKPKNSVTKKNCFKNFSLWFDLYVRNGKECEEDGDDYGNEE